MKQKSTYLIKVLAVADNQEGYAIEDIFSAKTFREAKYLAVSKYLENFTNTDNHGTNFLNIIDRHYWKTETDNLIDELFDFFQDAELDIFAGSHVTNTLSIQICEKTTPEKNVEQSISENQLLMSLLNIKGKIECEGF